MRTLGYAAAAADAPLAPFTFERRNPGPHDVAMRILYCGICRTDVHQARNEWGRSVYPMVPGHEIAGRVTEVGSEVKRIQIGDLVGVGCMVDSCRTCANCRRGWEQFCEPGCTFTYNALDRNGELTYGGYSERVVVDEHFVLRITHAPADLAGVAPLLCAGITTYSPLRHWGVGPGSKVGVIGLGGLGHMAVKLAHAMGAVVVLFTRSAAKSTDAKRLGADAVAVTSDENATQGHRGSFDFIVDTVAAGHDLNPYLELLKHNGTLTLVGVPGKPLEVVATPLIMGRLSLAGSLIGGIAETQEMLDFCAHNRIVSDVEVIPIQQVNAAYDRIVKSDVRYRFAIDMASLNGAKA